MRDQKNLAAVMGHVDGDAPVTFQLVQNVPGPRQKTDKQHASELGFRTLHFTAWANALGIPSVTIAKQIVRNVADVEAAIRQAGKATAPAPKAPKKPTTAMMTADEIAEAAGLKLVTRGAK